MSCKFGDLMVIKIPNNLRIELTDRPPSKWEIDPSSTTKALKTELMMEPQLIGDGLDNAV